MSAFKVKAVKNRTILSNTRDNEYSSETQVMSEDIRKPSSKPPRGIQYEC